MVLYPPKEIESDSYDDLGIIIRQKMFAKFLGRFLVWLEENGYEVTTDEAFRPPATAALYAKEHIGIKNSLHIWRLAMDLNLFRAGVWLRDAKDYAAAGTQWKSYHPLCRWGGDFHGQDAGDGRHFSLSWDGLA